MAWRYTESPGDMSDMADGAGICRWEGDMMMGDTLMGDMLMGGRYADGREIC